MTRMILLFAALLLTFAAARAQTLDSTLLLKNHDFTGATATKDQYQVVVQLDTDDPKIIGKAMRNIANVLKDPRMMGKVKVELVTSAGGTDAVLKSGKYESDLKMLVEQGVIVAQCSNSLRERKIPRGEIFDFIAVVPSGAGEVIMRQAEGWSVLKP